MNPSELTQSNQTIKSADRDAVPRSENNITASSRSDKDSPDNTTLIDLSDPNGYELLLDDTPENDTNLQKVQKRLITIDLANQRGVTKHGNYIILPGRISLLLLTLFLILFSVIGMSLGFIHFSTVAPNYLLAFAILQIILFVQIILYHSAYRAQRTTIRIIVTIVTILIMTIIDIFFYDLIFYPKNENSPYALLLVTMISFTSIPTIMFAHLVFLGRGTRTVGFREKSIGKRATQILPAVNSQQDTTTEILPRVPSKDIPADTTTAVENKD